MQPYKFKVKYELGPKNIADPLSRLMGNQKISSSHSSEAEEYIRFVAVNATPVLWLLEKWKKPQPLMKNSVRSGNV